MLTVPVNPLVFNDSTLLAFENCTVPAPAVILKEKTLDSVKAPETVAIVLVIPSAAFPVILIVLFPESVKLVPFAVKTVAVAVEVTLNVPVPKLRFLAAVNPESKLPHDNVLDPKLIVPAAKVKVPEVAAFPLSVTDPVTVMAAAIALALVVKVVVVPL